MNDAIRKLSSAYTDACIARGEDWPLSREVEAELTATETAIAVMKQNEERFDVLGARWMTALYKIKQLTTVASSDPNNADATDVALHDIRRYAANALTETPTGKRLVEVEKLKELEWYLAGSFQTDVDRFEESYLCTVCGKSPDEGHATDCWLAALLKEAS